MTTAYAASEQVSLSSGRLNLSFDTSADRISLSNLADSAGLEWMNASPSNSFIWLLDFQKPGAYKEVKSSEAKFTGVRKSSDKLIFTWNVPLEEQNAVVTMTVRCPKSSPLSYWSLQVNLPKGWQMARADFPVIPNIKLQPNLKVAVTAGWGLEYDVKPDLKYDSTYPSCTSIMQFLAFYNQGKGLYIGTHDPQGNHKYYNVQAGKDNVSFFCLNWPGNTDKTGGVYKVPYEAVLGVFDGSYYEAAQIYRDFSFKTAWGKLPISKREMPQWVKDNDLWFMMESLPVSEYGIGKKLVDYFGMPFGFHWYRWFQIPHDIFYPDYFPPKPGFAGGVKELQALGIRVMPYINGRLSDEKSKTWPAENLEKATCKYDGKPIQEVYIPNVPLDIMCPYTEQWQKKIADVADTIANVYGTDGVYIDQICAAAAVRCFDPTHGHPVGGGHFWVDGYRKMMDEVRSRIPKDKILTTEENIECFIDKFDLQLLVNTPINTARPIPLYPAVYSGRSMAFGFQYDLWRDSASHTPVRAKQARAFVWGSQIGWVHADRLMEPASAKEAEYLRNMARCRRFGHQYVVSGRFLGMLDIAGSNPIINYETSDTAGKMIPQSTPTIFASAWLAEDGSLGVLLTNISDDEHEISITLPLAKAGMRAGDHTIKTFGPEGLISTERSSAAVQKIKLAGRGAMILSIGK